MSSVNSEPLGPTKLLNRNFLLLWQGQMVSQAGRQCFLIAMMFWVKETTGSAGLVGLMMMLSSLPGLFLGPLGGTFADRHSRRTILVVSDALRGTWLLAFAGLMWWRPAEQTVVLTALFGVAILGGVVNAFFTPAVGAMIPDLVPKSKLAAANSMNQLSIRGAMFVGQAVGGVLYRLLGAPMLFLINGASYLISAASEALIQDPDHEARTEAADVEAEPVSATWRRYVADTVEGFRFVLRDSGLSSLLWAVSGLNLFFMPIFILLPFYVEDTLGEAVDVYGYLMATFGVGGLLGYLLAGAISWTPRRRGRAFIGCLLLAVLFFAVPGLFPTTAVAFVAFFLIGVVTSVVDLLAMTLFQLASPREMRGRVMGLVLAFSRAISPLGMALGGIAGDLTQIPAVYLACSACACVIAVFHLARPGFRAVLFDAESSSDLTRRRPS